MPIFQDPSGLAVKFFIQKDLPQQTQVELCETITSLGGRVEQKVPRQGYILVQPGTAEEERLRLCWTSPDRPERHFVPHTYVEACKIAGMLLKQIFVEPNGGPMRMHIHPSIANPNARNALSQRIMHSGGDPHAPAQSARVILADPSTDVFPHLVKTYQGVPDKYIESYLWVKKCIERGSVIFTPLVYKNPGGRRPGEERMQFTEEDEEHLCSWIATKIPYKETGGRTGNRLYQQLCDLSADPEYAWASRHTWQSWRERYKKNASRLDVLIAAIVEQKKPTPGEKGQYGYVRQPEIKPKKARKRKEDGMGRGDFEELMVSNIANAHPPVLGLVPHGGQSLSTPTPETHPGTPYATLQSTSAPGIVQRAEEEMEDENDWLVRVGDAEPPPWGKRKAEEESSDDLPAQKRPRTDAPHGFHEAPALDTDALVALANMHVVDQGIHAIASEFKFTPEEVREYYDKCGEMERTRSRFESMRALLSERFGGED